jgi:putative addiction module antidote
MSHRLKVCKIGDSHGVILPKGVLEALGVKEGDSLIATESPNGLSLTASSPDLEKMVQIFEDISHRYQNTLRELAK